MSHRIHNTLTYIALFTASFLTILFIFNRIEALDSYTCNSQYGTVTHQDPTIWSTVEKHCNGNIQNAVHDTITLNNG